MRLKPAVARPLVLAVLAGAALAACAPSSTPGGTPGGASSGPPGGAEEDAEPSPGVTGTQEYRPGMPASTALPDGAPTAVVVLVPGGGWSTANPDGFASLERTLLEADLAVVTITYGTSSTGDHFPVPADDVACAISFAAAQVPDVPVVAVGHSAGAHLAVLAGLVPDGRPATGSACDHPAHPADGVVGLAGPYDIAATGGSGQNLFGVPVAEDPEAWSAGNPLTWVDERPDLPVLLLHGDADRVVPVFFSEDLAQALEAAGHDVRLEILADVDHIEIIRPDLVADPIITWLAEAVTSPT